MTDVESDRISSLPDHLKDQILSNLSIKEAVRTSVLSSNWRKKWSTQPDLVFDHRCVSTETSKDPSVIKSKFLRIVDHVLLLHSGPINKFKVSDFSYDLTIGKKSLADVDRWIHHLAGRSIKEFVLTIRVEEYYKIPWCLFSYQILHDLILKWCWLEPPMTFEGFRNLKSLVLDDVLMTQNSFENLISGCPQLEKLMLSEVQGLTQFNIQAPNIKLCHITNDKFEGISFNNTLQLAEVYLELSLYLNSESNQSNLFKFFDHLPQIQCLMIVNYSIKV
jgi:hypothetical protein